MNPLIGRTCTVVDVTLTEETRTPGIVMDVVAAPTVLRAGDREMTTTDTWVLLVLLDGGRLSAVSHRQVEIT